MFKAKSLNNFDEHFKALVHRTCEEWNFSLPKSEYYQEIYYRLPYGLQEIISFGFESELIIDVGISKSGSAGFRPNNVSESKGPYSWFEKDNSKHQPRPCWEYFVQAAEYIRLSKVFGKDYKLKFEDNSMDIAMYKGENLWICCEIKEKSNQASRLISGIRKFENVIDLPKNDRGNDPLRKAKYIRNFKPEYFYVVSLGRRYEFRIEYLESEKFKLIEDLIPFY
jgi:hypothetical protein